MNFRLFTGTLAAAVGLATLISLPGCASSQAATPTQPPAKQIELTVLHTNDVFGYVEPCG